MSSCNRREAYEKMKRDAYDAILDAEYERKPALLNAQESDAEENETADSLVKTCEYREVGSEKYPGENPLGYSLPVFGMRLYHAWNAQLLSRLRTENTETDRERIGALFVRRNMSNFAYDFPVNKRAKAATLDEQMRKIAEEHAEVMEAYQSVLVEPEDFLGEMMDLRFAMEGALRKFSIQQVGDAWMRTVNKAKKRGDI